MSLRMSSESEIVGNPLVSGFVDDLDPEDVFSTKDDQVIFRYCFG